MVIPNAKDLIIDHSMNQHSWMDELLFDAIMQGQVDDIPCIEDPLPLSLTVPTYSQEPGWRVPKTSADYHVVPISVGSLGPSEDPDTDWLDDDFDFDAHIYSTPRTKCVSPPSVISPESDLIAMPVLSMAPNGSQKRKLLMLPFSSKDKSNSVSESNSTNMQPHSVSSVPLIGKPMGLDYIDYAEVPEQEQAIPPEERNTGGVQNPFPERLHDMLTQDKYPDIVSWAPHGRCFVVRKPKEFEKNVLEQYFNQTKYRSFQRQLNLYGFKRLTGGSDRGGYYHPLMLRGRRKLCTRMRRLKPTSKLGGPIVTNSALSPELEPNFYSMTPVDDSGSTNSSKKPIKKVASVHKFNLAQASPLTTALLRC